MAGLKRVLKAAAYRADTVLGLLCSGLIDCGKTDIGGGDEGAGNKAHDRIGNGIHGH